MDCKYAKKTDKPWFVQAPEGARTVRCYYPDRSAPVAGGYARFASIGDTIDKKKPVLPQLIKDADYVAVRSCLCGIKTCKYYQIESRKEGEK